MKRLHRSPILICIHLRVLLTVTIPNHRRFPLHLENLVGCDGVKYDVDDDNDGNRDVNVNGFDQSTRLYPASLDTHQRLIFFGYESDKIQEPYEAGHEDWDSKGVEAVEKESLAFTPATANSSKVRKNIKVKVKHLWA